jgi:SAM-dependent methyltransferase
MPNYFAPQTAAERYARGRFIYQDQIIAHLRQRLPLTFPVAQALDVACGTGNSTLALVPIAQAVIGVDPSAAMLALAPRDPHITYLVGDAEALPVADASCDLLTIASAFHWMNHTAALTEAARVVRPQGWIAIYDNLFTAQSPDLATYHEWYRQRYAPHFPGPPKPRADFTGEQVPPGLRYEGLETLEGSHHFTLETFIDYLTSISNIQLAIQEGTPIEEIETWLRTELAPLFATQPNPRFLFRRPIWLLARL